MPFPQLRFLMLAVPLALSCFWFSPAAAQDFYDPTILRTVAINFDDPDWLQLLQDNYASQTNILADLVVDNVTYPDVGVRIRGNTSFFRLPPGSVKFSLNVDVDFVNVGQEVLGYDSLNLNNGFADPTFCREIVYNNFVAQFIPNPRANHVVLTLNGENWGVYNNVQQFDKTMLATYFSDTDGLRIKVPNNPNGPGLRYNGPNASGYTGYEIKDDGGFADPWAPLIDVCWSVTNGTSLSEIDPLFAVDPSCWSVVLENLLTDDDSYVNKGADFMAYRNPTDGRMFVLQTDANETFRENWNPLYNFTDANKPVLSHVIANFPEARARYMAHFRTVMENLNWDYFGPLFEAQRDLIDAAVQADDKKIYSYEDFLDNFTTSVHIPGGGPGGQVVIGLRLFVEQRESFLGFQEELNGSAPLIADVTPSATNPAPSDPVEISATVTPGSTAIASVELFYRETPSDVYQSVAMVDQGSDVWSATLPINALGGQIVSYYVGATSSDSFGSMSFEPSRTEWAPLTIEYGISSAPGMRITEWMYSGTNEEYVEFTNWSETPVDMAGYSFDDSGQMPGAFDLSAFGVVDPFESVVLTQGVAETFRAAWGLDASVKIIGELGLLEGSNLGRNDEVNLYDSVGALIDRLTYGDQDFPGSIRTRDASGQVCCQSLGLNDVTAWSLSTVGDLFGSWTSTGGDVGTPGSYDVSGCADCDSPASVPAIIAEMLLGPQPNPFREQAEIRYQLDRDQHVRIVVHDVAGREVRRLVDGVGTAGEHVALWDGQDTSGRPSAAGIYFVRLSSDDRTETRSFVRLR